MQSWLNLRQLSFFKAVAETSSFTAAAQRCGVSQPGLSAAIRDFEEELGVRLFQRDTRNVSLTPQGEALLPLVEVSLNNAAQTANDIQALVKSKQKNVRIAAVSSITSHLLPAAVEEFENTHTDAKIEVIDVANNEVTERVYDGRADIGVGLGPFDLTTFEPIFLFSDRLAVVASQRHPLAAFDQVTWAEVGLHPIASYLPTSHVYEMIDSTLASQGIRYKPFGTYSYRQTLFGWVMTGRAVTILPSLSLQQTLPRRLVHIPLGSPEVSRQYFVFRRKGRVFTEHTRAVFDFLKWNWWAFGPRFPSGE